RQRRAIERDVLGFRQVVGDRDRPEDSRQVPRLGAVAPGLGLVDLSLVLVQRRVGAAEVGLLADELVHARARAVGVVVDRLARAGVLEGLLESGHRVGLRGRAAGLERLLAAAVRRAGVGRVRAAGGATAARVV